MVRGNMNRGRGKFGGGPSPRGRGGGPSGGGAPRGGGGGKHITPPFSTHISVSFHKISLQFTIITIKKPARRCNFDAIFTYKYLMNVTQKIM